MQLKELERKDDPETTLVVRRLMECSLRWGYWLLKATPVLPLGSTRLLPGVSYPREIQES